MERSQKRFDYIFIVSASEIVCLGTVHYSSHLSNHRNAVIVDWQNKYALETSVIYLLSYKTPVGKWQNTTTATVLRPFVQDYAGESVPEG